MSFLPHVMYVAAPYRGNSNTLEARMCLIAETFRALRSEGFFVTSPLLHHWTFDANEATSGQYWLDYSEFVLNSLVRQRDAGECMLDMTLVQFPDWTLSSGVELELKIAQMYNIPVRYKLPPSIH